MDATVSVFWVTSGKHPMEFVQVQMASSYLGPIEYETHFETAISLLKTSAAE